jgi:4-hydroxybenzoate polyprenyltransferase
MSGPKNAMPWPEVARALTRLSRPSGAALVPLLPLLCLWFAHWDRALAFNKWGTALVIVLIWGALHCGTMWLNAVLDEDEGDLLFGEACTVPPQTASFGYLALFLAALGGTWLGWGPGLLSGSCAVLAVLYSHPALRWKAHPVGGPFVNVVGYGLCSPLLGWWVADVPVNARTVAVLATVPVFVLGCYLLAQSFQGTEDAKRGYRTFVVMYGPKATIRVARICFHVVFSQFLLLSLLGWLPRTVLALVIPYFFLARHLLDWSNSVEPGGVGEARTSMRLLAASAIVLLVAMLAHQSQSLLTRGPSAGLNTEHGLPVDRLEVRQRALVRMAHFRE